MEIIKEYLKTKFVFDGFETSLYFNEYNEELHAFMKKYDFHNYAVFTAYNPYPEICSDELNRERQKELLSALNNYKFIEGFGYSSDGQHYEKQVIVFNIDFTSAANLGVAYGQLAIGYGDLYEAFLVILKSI